MVVLWITAVDMKYLCRGFFALRFVASFLASFIGYPSSSFAVPNFLHGFPAEFKVSELWEHLVIDGKPTRAYRFVANQSIDDVKAKVADWMKQPQGSALEHSKNGWTYFSHRKEGIWITIQVRQTAGQMSPSVEGLLSFWEDSNHRVGISAEPLLVTVRKMHVVRRLESVDKGRSAITITAVSDAGVDAIANGLAVDLKSLGFVPAGYAPPSFLPNAKVANPHGAISRAWIGPDRQVLFSVFEHRGKTAAQIYVLGGKHLE
jgi:hypothetical protein